MNKRKFDLIKEFLQVMWNDESLWIIPETCHEHYLQRTLRNLCSMIENNFTEDRLKREIQLYKEHLGI